MALIHVKTMLRNAGGRCLLVAEENIRLATKEELSFLAAAEVDMQIAAETPSLAPRSEVLDDGAVRRL